MTKLMILAFMTGMEIICIESYFCRYCEKRAHFGNRVMIFIFGLIFYSVFMPHYLLGIFFHVPVIFLSFVYVMCCYQITYAVGLFILTASYTIESIGGLFCSYLALFFPEQIYYFGLDVKEPFYVYFIMLGCVVLAFFLCSRIFIQSLQNIQLPNLASKPIVILSVVMLAVNQIIGMFFDLYAAPEAGPELRFVEYTWNMICCIFCLFIQFHIYRIGQREKELEITYKLIEKREKQYEVSRTNIDAINQKCHNLKYHLSAMEAAGTDPKFIDEAMMLVESFDTSMHTGNEALDVIFTEKSHYCKLLQINFTCMIDGEKLSFMDVQDLYVMFGNIIDNAIHAVQNLEKPAERNIYINVRQDKQFILISSENRFGGEIEFKDGMPKTSTHDEMNHGFGMRSIAFIVDKYNGSMNAKAKNQVFYLNIVIPL